MSDSKLTRAQGVVLLVVVPVGLFMFGAVTSALWGWFVVPTFGAPPLSIPAAIGLRVLASLVRPPLERFDFDAFITRALLGPPMFLCVGWVVQLFI